MRTGYRTFLSVALVPSLLALGCSEIDLSGEDETRPASEDTSPPAEEVDPPGERELDLSWREECRWLGVNPDETEELTDVLDLFVWLHPEDLEELYTRDVRSDDRLTGEFAVGNDEARLPLDPGLRFRGNSARFLPKKSFNVRFPGHVEGLDDDRTNLNAMYTDPSQLREHLAMRMFREAGVPTPRTHYVDLHLNDVYEGLYIAIQRVDEWLLAEHDLPSGGSSLVRDRTRQALGSYTSLFAEVEDVVDDRDAIVELLQEYMDSRGEPDWNAVADLVLWTHTDEEPEQRLASLQELIDIDAFVTWYAVHVVTGDMDSFADDYWLYKPPDDDALWQIIPWDADLSFGSHFHRELGGVANDLFHIEYDTHDTASRQNPFLREFLAIEEVSAELDQQVELLMGAFSLPWMCSELSRVAPAIEGSAMRAPSDDAFDRHPANHHSAIEDHHLHVAALLDFVQLRWAFLDRQMSPEGEPDTAAVSVDENDVGQSVLFTDADGWTIGRLDVEQVHHPGEIRLSVEASSRSGDVDRLWTIESDDADVDGKLSLYYRNTDRFGNWYTASEDLEPIEGQSDLGITEVTGEGASDRLASTVNPYSNRVMAEIRLQRTRELVLQRDTSE